MNSTAEYHFNPPFQEPRGSAIRELAKLADDPAFISFAGGYPAADSFDLEGLRAAADQAWEAGPRQCMQYGATEGSQALRDALLALTRQRGMRVESDQLLVTTGSQQGLDFLLRSQVAPGDVVLVENPTYPGALAALRLAGAEVIGIDGDEHGIDVEAVERALSSLPRKPKMLYVVASFANPTGATLALARRLGLLELAAKHRFLVVEDDPYGALRFRGEAVLSIRALAADVPGSEQWVAYLSTLSKIVTPGLRVGWMVAPAAVTRRCVMAKQVSDMCSSPWNQAIAAQYLHSARLETSLPRTIDLYRTRAQGLSTHLREAFGERLSFSEPEGGMFLWARLRERVDMQALFANAIKEKVLFIPGTQCHADGRETGGLRLSYSNASPDIIREGVERLRRACLATT